MDIPIEYIITTIGTVGSGFFACGAYIVKAIILPTLRTLKSMDKVHKQVAHIYSEVCPNGGSSLKDQVVGIASEISWLVAKDRAEADLDKACLFQTGKYGEFRWANKAFLRLTSLSTDELVGQGWKNLLHPDDVERVARNWALCVADAREYRDVFRIKTSTGHELRIKCEVLPCSDQKQSLLGYWGQWIVDPI